MTERLLVKHTLDGRAVEVINGWLCLAGAPEADNVVTLDEHPNRQAILKAVPKATHMAGRGPDIPLDAAVLAAGGLHVIGAALNPSRRIDRQLFGRSGRQGEPGSVRAIVCWQDALFHDLPPALRRLLAALPGSAGACALQPARAWAQWLAERRAYGVRMQTLRQDRELNRLIGFAGPQR